MTTTEERFAHIPAADKAAAVTGFVRRNPLLDGVDFHTMMDMILDADAHLPLVGDVVIEGDTATALVAELAKHPRLR